MIDLEKKTAKEKLVSWYETLSASKRKNLTLFGGGAGLFVIATILIIATSDDTKSFIEKKGRLNTRCSMAKAPGRYPLTRWPGRSKS